MAAESNRRCGIGRRDGEFKPAMSASSAAGRAGLLRKPLFDFGGPDNSLWRDGIQRARADLGAGRNFAGRKLLGLGLTGEGLRTTRIVSGLLVFRKMNRDVP